MPAQEDLHLADGMDAIVHRDRRPLNNAYSHGGSFSVCLYVA